MSLLNLSLPELLALFGTISAALVTLYLLDRSRRKQVVATLRFWRTAQTAESLKQKRRIQQPWSLLLQLLGVALLLAAIAQPRWGDRLGGARDHVLILDTSAWMGARTSRGTVMDDARLAALAYMKRLPAADRLMIVRADALATPATPFDDNRTTLERAIRETTPAAAALNLAQALEFAGRIQKLNSERPGEIVYVGPGRVGPGEESDQTPANLRVIPIAAPAENCGFRKLGLRRADAETWQVFVSTRNYGQQPHTVQLAVQFGGAPIGERTLVLKPASEQEQQFSFRTRAAGWMEARILTNDAFPEDDRAVLEAPAQPALNVAVYSDAPDALRAILGASPNVRAHYWPASAYDPKVKADAVVIDRFAAAPPLVPAIWIEPPAARSPVPVRSVVNKAKLTEWTSTHDLGEGLRTRDVEVETATVFAPETGDITVASSAAGPVIVARPESGSRPKQVVLGFHPALSAMKYELATPLLFANILRWLDPGVFRQWELNAGVVGAVEAKVSPSADPKRVTVMADGGRAIPYTMQGDHVRFFAGAPGAYRLHAGDQEIVYSLTLPDLGENNWTAPARAIRGIPRALGAGRRMVELWPWLALAGVAALVAEWILYGRNRRESRTWKRTATARTRVIQRKAS